MSEIRIRQWYFEVTEPYEAGHQLDEWEAQALNALRRENIRNLVTSKLREMEQARADGGICEDDLAKLRLLCEELDHEYHFGRRRPRAHVETLLRHVEQEARTTLAEDGITEDSPGFTTRLAALQQDKGLIASVRQRLRIEARRVEESLADL